MAISIKSMRELLAAGLTPSQMKIVLNILASLLEKVEERKAKDRSRQKVRRLRLGVSPKEWSELRRRVIERDGMRCQYCSAQVTADNLHIDHKQPLYRGGKSDLSNLVVACAACNMSKGSWEHDEWLACR